MNGFGKVKHGEAKEKHCAARQSEAKELHSNEGRSTGIALNC